MPSNTTWLALAQHQSPEGEQVPYGAGKHGTGHRSNGIFPVGQRAANNPNLLTILGAWARLNHSVS
ncbi:MAG: hypothetical protein WC621_03315 [Patescibacteria group bacterium]